MYKAVLLNDTSSEPHHGCMRVMQNINKFLAEQGLTVIARLYVQNSWQKDCKIKKAIEEADVVVVNGEGTIHHDAPLGVELIEAGSFAKKIGKKAFLINCTYQDNISISKSSLDAFDIISVRESWSQRQLSQLGVDSIIVPDFTFYQWVDYGEIIKKPERKNVGFCDSIDRLTRIKIVKSVPNNATYYPIHYKMVSKDSKKRNSSMFKKLSRQKFHNILYDLTYFYYLRRFVTKNIDSTNNFIEELASLSSLYTGRFHSLCFAIMTKTPLVIFPSNTHKIEAVVDDVGLSVSRLVQNGDAIGDEIECRGLSDNELKNIDSFKIYSERQFKILSGCFRSHLG